MTESDSILKKAKRFVLNHHKAKKSTRVTPFDLTEKNALKICVLIVSSTGDGNMPENGEHFERFLLRESHAIGEKSTSKMFSHVSYTILGLGDSNYSKY